MNTDRKEIVYHCDASPEIYDYKHAFDLFDKNHSGTISVNDIIDIMKHLGYYHIIRKEVDEIVTKNNLCTDGELDFEEFYTFVENYKTILENKKNAEELILKVFEYFNKDKNGKISIYEFKYIFSKLHDYSFTEEECNKFIKKLDLDNDGILHYKDFISFGKSLLY